MSQETAMPPGSPWTVPWDRLVLVAGHPRGGTTWLAAMLDQADDVRYIFEPENAEKKWHPVTPFSEDVWNLFRHGGERWFLDGSEQDEELARVANSWREHLASLVRHYHGEHVPLLLIKMPETEKLRWVVETLGVDRVIYIKRHPLGVVNSHAKRDLYAKWNIGNKIGLLMEEAATLGIEIDFDRAKTWEEKLALFVHARYSLLGRVLEGTNHLVVDYEDLCYDTTSKMRGIFEWCDWEWNTGIERRIEEMVNPSTDQHGLNVVQMRSAKRAFAWREELAPHHIRGVRRLFAQLKISGYGFPGQGLAPLTIHERAAGARSYLRRQLKRRARRIYNAARSSAIRLDAYIYKRAENAAR